MILPSSFSQERFVIIEFELIFSIDKSKSYSTVQPASSFILRLYMPGFVTSILSLPLEKLGPVHSYLYLKLGSLNGLPPVTSPFKSIIPLFKLESRS